MNGVWYVVRFGGLGAGTWRGGLAVHWDCEDLSRYLHVATLPHILIFSVTVCPTSPFRLVRHLSVSTWTWAVYIHLFRMPACLCIPDNVPHTCGTPPHATACRRAIWIPSWWLNKSIFTPFHLKQEQDMVGWDHGCGKLGMPYF